MKHSINIRSAKAGEWKLWKEIRLQALVDAPESFGERHEDSQKKTDETWEHEFQKIIKSDNQCLLFAEASNQTVGMLYVFVRNPSDDVGGIGGLWISPEYRKMGVGTQILE